jgi:hypothetical protein
MAFNGPAWLMGILFASEEAKPTSGQIRIVGKPYFGISSGLPVIHYK